MAHDEGKRSSGTESQAQASGTAGVGGRHEDPPSAARGGGYLDICSIPESPSGDHRKIAADELAELRAMGLNRMWIAIAERIGVDAFLAVWATLDEHLQDSGASRPRICVPRFSTYLRYQRNRFIQAMGDQGLDARAVRESVARQLRERLSLRHVARVMGASKES